MRTDSKQRQIVNAQLTNPADGTDLSGNPNGRAAASAGSPVTVSNEDKAALDEAGAYADWPVYTGGAPVGAGIAINVTTAGTVALTSANGNVMTINLPIGFIILPLQCNAAAVGTAVATFYKLVN